MIGTALKLQGYIALEDFTVHDPVGNGDRKDFILKWLSKDKPRPTNEQIETWCHALEQGYVEPVVPKTPEERITELEKLVETQANEIGTLKALWSSE